MQRLVSVRDMKRIETNAAGIGCDSLALVKRAGEACFTAIHTIVPESLQLTFVTLIGPGNNGADTTVLVKHLQNAGVRVLSWTLDNQFRNVGEIEVSTDALALPDALLSDLAQADVIVDGMFGTGARPLDLAQEALVRKVNSQGKKIIAIDLPTGVDADTGQMDSVSIEAQQTIALGYAKQGLYQYPGRKMAGQIVVVPIGLDDPVLLPERMDHTFVLDPTTLIPEQPLIRQDSHKGSYGKVVVVGGSIRYPGAPRLTGVAAYRSGAGYVTLATEQALYEQLLEYELGLALSPFTVDKAGTDELVESINAAQAVAIGPGFGLGEERASFIRELLLRLCDSSTPVVLDADGLNAVDQTFLQQLGKKRKFPLILTPHPREMARLCSITSAAVQADRIALTRKMAGKWQAIIVLKGANTLIATPEGTVFVFDIDLPALAVAGTGDVLTGMISALLAQGVDQIKAVQLAVAAHITAGQRWVQANGRRGMVADDLLTHIPSVLFPVAPTGDPE